MKKIGSKEIQTLFKNFLENLSEDARASYVSLDEASKYKIKESFETAMLLRDEIHNLINIAKTGLPLRTFQDDLYEKASKKFKKVYGEKARKWIGSQIFSVNTGSCITRGKVTYTEKGPYISACHYLHRAVNNRNYIIIIFGSFAVIFTAHALQRAKERLSTKSIEQIIDGMVTKGSPCTFPSHQIDKGVLATADSLLLGYMFEQDKIFFCKTIIAKSMMHKEQQHLDRELSQIIKNIENQLGTSTVEAIVAEKEARDKRTLIAC